MQLSRHGAHGHTLCSRQATQGPTRHSAGHVADTTHTAGPADHRRQSSAGCVGDHLAKGGPSSHHIPEAQSSGGHQQRGRRPSPAVRIACLPGAGSRAEKHGCQVTCGMRTNQRLRGRGFEPDLRIQGSVDGSRPELHRLFCVVCGAGAVQVCAGDAPRSCAAGTRLLTSLRPLNTTAVGFKVCAQTSEGLPGVQAWS